ncbi:hypothetical protein [Helicobacter cynogastricus]|uniref:hypothetical protein n=1 Tax=Helicobacter cynogastricus TaxID=329937 RepID=UPI000CF1453F|nr:hypothetical protein [Helicobacter cynogastricus]
MVDIYSLKQWQKWFVRVKTTSGEVREGVFCGYDGPSFDEYEEGEDEILLDMQITEGHGLLLSFESADIAAFTPIRKATDEELGMWGR